MNTLNKTTSDSLTAAEGLLSAAGIRPTTNRLIVMRELMESPAPVGLIDLEETIETLERSSILRTLTLLQSHHLIHTIEDGRGVTKYELCHGHDNCTADDMHPHFYCEICNKVTCFSDKQVPAIDLPEGYRLRTVNFMLKGICPECNRRLADSTE